MNKTEYNVRNPWTKFKIGDAVRFRGDPTKVGMVVAVRDTVPDKTGLVDTYAKVKWKTGTKSSITTTTHVGHLEAVNVD